MLAPTPAMRLDESEKKGLAEKAIRRLLILKHATLGCLGASKGRNG